MYLLGPVIEVFLPRGVHSVSEGKSPNGVASSLERISGYVLNRLLSLKTTWIQICFTLTELQHLLLELRGCLDYLEIFKPMMDLSHIAPSNPTTIHTIGTFTTNARVAEEFNSVGIPVWFVQRQHMSDFGNNVLAEVDPVDYCKHLVMDKHPDFPLVFKGKRDADSFIVVAHPQPLFGPRYAVIIYPTSIIVIAKCYPTILVSRS
ncbi:hypothetical protein BJ165DRAFT_1409897 [Panaeolus papilionaceus]|nr:hypothetical protein BJ165DRAFT_1409897 [Panaeolus papilionaceus]